MTLYSFNLQGEETTFAGAAGSDNSHVLRVCWLNILCCGVLTGLRHFVNMVLRPTITASVVQKLEISLRSLHRVSLLLALKLETTERGIVYRRLDAAPVQFLRLGAAIQLQYNRELQIRF